MQSNIQVTLRP